MSDDFDRLPAPLASLSGAERYFRAEWLVNVQRTASGAPMVTADYAARQGAQVRFVDLRAEAELTGPLGHIPGADWVPRERVDSLAQRLPPGAHVVLVSGTGRRAEALARALEEGGHPFVAGLLGGMALWKELGFGITRDRAILGRRDALRPLLEVRPHPGALTEADVLAHVKDPEQVRTVRMAALLVHARLSCVDGRDASGVIGTPGGDVGELVLGLAALEQVTGLTLAQETVAQLLHRRHDAFGRCYLHSDYDAARLLAAALRADARFEAALAQVHTPEQWRAFLHAPPPALRGPLLEALVEPKHLGCGHLKKLGLHSQAYGVREGLLTLVLRAFWEELWAGGDPEHVVLFGGHEEQAVLNVRLASPVRAFSSVPLVSPQVDGRQVFINHPQVSAFMRQELAHFLLRQSDLLPVAESQAPALFAAIEALAARQLGLTLGALAKGLPVFDVTFDGAEVSAQRTGSVPAAPKAVP